MLRTLRIWLALGVVALAAPASASTSASIVMAFQSIDFTRMSGSILLSSYVGSSDVLRLPGSVSLTSVYTPPQNVEASLTLGGRLEWRWDRFRVSPAESGTFSTLEVSSTLSRVQVRLAPRYPTEAIPEPGAALLFAAGSGIVALRLRGARRPA